MGRKKTCAALDEWQKLARYSLEASFANGMGTHFAADVLQFFEDEQR
jgi:hypothetical protein